MNANARADVLAKYAESLKNDTGNICVIYRGISLSVRYSTEITASVR